MRKKGATQTLRRTVRIVGLISLAAALIMAVYGPTMAGHISNSLAQLGYWTVFLLALLAAFYCALLDIRFTRLQYKLEERKLFHDVFLNEEFKASMEEAQAARKKDSTPPSPDNN